MVRELQNWKALLSITITEVGIVSVLRRVLSILELREDVIDIDTSLKGITILTGKCTGPNVSHRPI